MKTEDIYNELKRFVATVTKTDFPDAKIVLYTPSLFKHRIYYGEYGESIEDVSSDNPLKILRETALVKNIIGTYLFSAGGKYKWFCYPEVLGEDYIFYDTATDVVLLQNAVQKINIIDEHGLSIRYNCYRSYHELNNTIIMGIRSTNSSPAVSNIYFRLPLITFKLSNFNRTSLCIKQNVEQKDSKYQLNSLFGMQCTASINVFSNKIHEAQDISNKLRLYAHSELQNKCFEDMVVISGIRNVDVSSEEQPINSKSVAGIIFELKYNDYVQEDIDIITNVKIDAKVNERNRMIILKDNQY